MWAILANLLGGPIINGILNAYKAKLGAETTQAKIDADVAQRELYVQGLETQAQAQLRVAEIGHAWEPEKIAFYITLLYYAKIVVWDVTLGNVTHGETDALRGLAAQWAQMIMAFYFGKRTFENIVRIIKR